MLNFRFYTDQELKEIETNLNSLSKTINIQARKNGWWPELEGMSKEATIEERVEFTDKINIGEKIALTHSELSEALEDARRPIPAQDKHCPAFSNFSIELADAVIRIFDLCGAFGIPIGSAMLAKMKANEKRTHKHGGKRF